MEVKGNPWPLWSIDKNKSLYYYFFFFSHLLLVLSPPNTNLKNQQTLLLNHTKEIRRYFFAFITMKIAFSYHLVPSTLSSFHKNQQEIKQCDCESKNGMMQPVFSPNSVCTLEICCHVKAKACRVIWCLGFSMKWKEFVRRIGDGRESQKWSDEEVTD